MLFSGFNTHGMWGGGPDMWGGGGGGGYFSPFTMGREQFGTMASGDPWSKLFGGDPGGFDWLGNPDARWDLSLMNPPKQSSNVIPGFLTRGGSSYLDGSGNQSFDLGIAGSNLSDYDPSQPQQYGGLDLFRHMEPMGIDWSSLDHKSFGELLRDRAASVGEKFVYGKDSKIGAFDVARMVFQGMRLPQTLAGAGAKIFGGAIYDWFKQKYAEKDGDLSNFFNSLGADNDEAARQAFVANIGNFGDTESGRAGGSGYPGSFGGEREPNGPGTGGGRGFKSGAGDPYAQVMAGMYGGGKGGYMGNQNIGAPMSWMMPVAGSKVGIPVIQGPSWVGPAFDPNKGY